MNNSHDAAKENKPQASNGAAPGLLILIRHAESEWNVLGKWTGRTDVHITQEARKHTAKLGEAIKDLEIHHAYTSDLIRTLETFTGIMQTHGNTSLIPEASQELSERDYGEYTGLNKWEVLEQLGEDIFTKIRRSWDHPIPGGETMQMVHARAVPFYKKQILPKLLAGQNVLIVGHGNTFRALIKHLEDISNEGIAEVEMPFGHIIIYRVTPAGKHHSKEIRKIDIVPPHA